MNMKSLGLALAATLIAASAHAATYRAGSLEAADPWSRPAAAGTNGAGYLVLTNRGAKADALVAVESPAARKVTIHSMSMAGGVMSMKAEPRVALTPGKAVTFGPGGYHLMLMGLARAAKPGDHLPATLMFASGAKLKLTFTVSDGMGPPTAPSMDQMDHMKH